MSIFNCYLSTKITKNMTEKLWSQASYFKEIKKRIFRISSLPITEGTDN